MHRVEVEFSSYVAHVRLNRADKMNALDAEMLEELVSAGERIKSTRGCRAVVLSGNGNAFCAGLDLDNLRNASGGGARKIDIATPYSGAANIAQHAVLQWRAIPVPIIAAVHGVAVGGGFQLALGADVRIVHPEAKLGLVEVKWGLIPDMGGMVLLRDLLSPDAAAELLYSAQVFDGAEALRLGLATRLSDGPIPAALALAGRIAELSPDAVRAAKRLLTHAGSSDDILRAEAREQRSLFGTPNQNEAFAAGMAKRAANFVD